MTETITLSGEWEESIKIETGSIFDVGFTLSNSVNDQKDALYMADGPWGVDYLEDYVTLDYLNILPIELEGEEDVLEIERQVELAGQVKGNINLFRHLRSGNQTLDVQEYNTVKFDIQNSMPVEVIIVPENGPEWENRLRFTIPANIELTTFEIPFGKFKNANGESLDITDIKTLVFSIIGDYTYYTPFSMQVSSVQFKQADVNEEEEFATVETISNYPNPFTSYTVIALPEASKEVSIVVSDALGRIVDHQILTNNSNQTTIKYEAPQLTNGVYNYSVTNTNNQQWKGSFIIN